MKVLLPYLDDYWREMVSVRALDRLNLSLTSYPENAPLSCRPDWRLDGVTPDAVPNLLALGELAPNYRVHVLRLGLRYRF